MENILTLKTSQRNDLNRIFIEANGMVDDVRSILKKFIPFIIAAVVGGGTIAGYNALEQNRARDLHLRRFNNAPHTIQQGMRPETLVDKYIATIPKHFTSRDYIQKIRPDLIDAARQEIEKFESGQQGGAQ